MSDCNKFGCKKLVTRCEACGRTANEIIMTRAEWISVKDRLPLIDKKVLTVDCASKYEEPDVSYYDPHSNPKTGWRDGEFMNVKVTHWMPLPPPPEPPNEE